MNSARILGISVDIMSIDEVVNFIGASLHQREQKLTIVTLNPEALVHAQKNISYKKSILSADLIIPDGIGVAAAIFFKRSYADRLKGKNLIAIQLLFYWFLLKRLGSISRSPGRDLLARLLSEAKSHVVIIGGKEKYNRSLGVLGISDFKISEKDATSGNLPKKVIDFCKRQKRPVVAGVALGMPKQEFVLKNIADALPLGSVVIGIGGSSESLACISLRPINIMRRYGLEWLWRVVRQPWRLIRIINATLVFPYYFSKSLAYGDERKTTS